MTVWGNQGLGLAVCAAPTGGGQGGKERGVGLGPRLLLFSMLLYINSHYDGRLIHLRVRRGTPGVDVGSGTMFTAHVFAVIAFGPWGPSSAPAEASVSRGRDVRFLNPKEDSTSTLCLADQAGVWMNVSKFVSRSAWGHFCLSGRVTEF